MPPTACVDPVRDCTCSRASWLASLLFVFVILGCAALARNVTLAIYALSFWHYYLYWLAYGFGAVSLEAFRRDAVWMKGVSLAALGYAYFTTPLDFLSLAVMTAGFSLNALAARALGADRTYYGAEVAGLPPLRVTSFPYSWISHPMLVGNITAFGATLLNAEFRSAWWPLAAGHVAMNVGLWYMELAVTPQRRSVHEQDAQTIFLATFQDRASSQRSRGAWLIAAGAAVVAALGCRWSGVAMPAVTTAVTAGVAVYSFLIWRWYSSPVFWRETSSDLPGEETG